MLFWILRLSFLASLLCVGGAFVAQESYAQSASPLLPHMHWRAAEYFKNNPEAWNQLLSRLPRRPPGPPQAEANRPPAPGGSWATGASQPSSAALCNPLLLTDGSVLLHSCGTPTWWKLTPNIWGSYANGSWSQIASLPVINGVQYAPIYHASAVLPDGRVLIVGGEYNGQTAVWTNMGAIYSPTANSWTPVAPPSGWPTNVIGDAQSVVLPKGQFMLGACCASPPKNALFNASTLTWTATAAPSVYQDEQGYTLLSNDKVLTIDTSSATKVELYDPATGAWSAAASTPVSLVDPAVCGYYEIGPAIMRSDGTLVAFGGNTGCSSAAPADPTAIYNVSTNSWVQGPNVPAINGAYYTLADAPAVLLPNGNILFAASPGYLRTPTHFFEFSSASSGNTITQVADPVYYASSSSAYYYNFLMLPNGQVLIADYSSFVEFYTPSPGVAAGAVPTITSVDGCVAPGKTYTLQGTQLGGRSEAAAYGDDGQSSTNYPLVRVVNNATGHVFYARTSNHSTRSVAAGRAGSTNYTVASNTEAGASTLYVVVNGVASAGKPVTISTTCPTLAVTPTTSFTTSGKVGGPFSPTSASYTLSAQSGSVSYAVANIPSWLTASAATSGTLAAGTSTTITFAVNSGANSLGAGAYSQGISFTNTTNNVGTTSRVVTLNVTKYATTTSLTSSLNPSAFGQSVTFTATLSGGSGATGTVTFKDGTATLGTGAVSSGRATYATSALAKGSHSITAVYSGDAKNAGSTSGVVTQQVQ